MSNATNSLNNNYKDNNYAHSTIRAKENPCGEICYAFSLIGHNKSACLLQAAENVFIPCVLL